MTEPEGIAYPVAADGRRSISALGWAVAADPLTPACRTAIRARAVKGAVVSHRRLTAFHLIV
jgi:hypothetical protein